MNGIPDDIDRPHVPNDGDLREMIAWTILEAQVREICGLPQDPSARWCVQEALRELKARQDSPRWCAFPRPEVLDFGVPA